jgi:hypothetical protein
MSFLRHAEIYASDGAMTSAFSSGRRGACRRSAPSDDQGRGFNPAPFPSSAMSLGSAIPWQVALQQRLPPLHRPESRLQPPAEIVNHHLTGGGEFSTGEMGNFQPALTGRTAPVRHVGSRDRVRNPSVLPGQRGHAGPVHRLFTRKDASMPYGSESLPPTGSRHWVARLAAGCSYRPGIRFCQRLTWSSGGEPSVDPA